MVWLHTRNPLVVDIQHDCSAKLALILQVMYLSSRLKDRAEAERKWSNEQTYFQTPGAFFVGCWAYISSAYAQLNLKKSTNSAAASISACQAFFPWPNMVAAIISYLYFPAIKSAAFKNTAARSENGRVDHSFFASRAPVIASLTCSVVACEEDANVVAWLDGMYCGDLSFVVIFGRLVSYCLPFRWNQSWWTGEQTYVFAIDYDGYFDWHFALQDLYSIL